MKEEKNMDWRMFELLENDLSAEEAEQLLSEIELDSDLEAEWSLMQQTKLEAEPVVFQNKRSLKKKETTLLAFSFTSWQKVASIAAVLALSFPLWKGILLNEDVSHQIPGAISAIEHKDNKLEKAQPEVLQPEVTPEVAEQPATQEVLPETPSYVKVNTPVVENPGSNKQVQQDEVIPPNTQPIEVEIPEINPKNNYVVLASADDIAMPEKAKNVAQSMVVPGEEEKKGFQGIRPTINIGLALLSAPFNNSKIKIGPLKDRKIEIEYSSDQYFATAMVSLRPLKN